MAGLSLDHHGLIEVLQLAVANIRAFVALQEADELQAYRASSENRLPQLEELQLMVARVETVLSNYEHRLEGLPIEIRVT